MAYPPGKIAALAASFVAESPLASTRDICNVLGVHRHTLQRALKSEGTCLSALRATAVLLRVEAFGARAEPAALKALWTDLGFRSASNFARFVRRTTGRPPRELLGTALLVPPGCKRARLILDRWGRERESGGVARNGHTPAAGAEKEK